MGLACMTTHYVSSPRLSIRINRFGIGLEVHPIDHLICMYLGSNVSDDWPMCTVLRSSILHNVLQLVMSYHCNMCSPPCDCQCAAIRRVPKSNIIILDEDEHVERCLVAPSSILWTDDLRVTSL